MKQRYGLNLWNGTGPVPNIHRTRRGSRYRGPKTQSERRLAQFFPEEGEVGPRAIRNHQHLVSAWHDIHRTDQHIDNWKRYRKTQYKIRYLILPEPSL